MIRPTHLLVERIVPNARFARESTTNERVGDNAFHLSTTPHSLVERIVPNALFVRESTTNERVGDNAFHLSTTPHSLVERIVPNALFVCESTTNERVGDNAFHLDPRSCFQSPRTMSPAFRIRTILRLTALAVLMLAAPAVAPAAAAPATADGVFGSQERNTSALIGIFYDLKQTQQRTPADGSKRFADIIDTFLASGLDEALLNGYYRAPLPLYTTQIAMPRMSAESAPKAFGVEDEVKPRAWVVHYKGQVAPPTDGTYRFIGRADDLMVVAINRRVVLDASLGSTRLPKVNWQPSEAKGPSIAAMTTPAYGTWIELKAGEPVDLDILVGERPGGIYHANLFYEKQGETYPKLGGKPVLPLFQVAERVDGKREYLTDRPVWKIFE